MSISDRAGWSVGKGGGGRGGERREGRAGCMYIRGNGRGEGGKREGGKREGGKREGGKREGGKREGESGGVMYMNEDEDKDGVRRVIWI